MPKGMWKVVTFSNTLIDILCEFILIQLIPHQIQLSGKYGFLDENGEIKIVEYSANNSTGFQSDLELEQVNPLTEAEAAPQQVNCRITLHAEGRLPDIDIGILISTSPYEGT